MIDRDDFEEGYTPYRFSVEAIDYDADEKNLLVRLRVVDQSVALKDDLDPPATTNNTGTTKMDAPTGVLIDATFNVDFFDFPMIDNSRLPDGHRCAVVLRSFDPSSARVALLYFPGSRASLKDKPFYDEIVDDLVRTRAKLEESD